MEWNAGEYYLEWYRDKLTLEIDNRSTSKLVYAQGGVSNVGNVGQTPRDRPYCCREFEYKYRDVLHTPGKKTKSAGVFRYRNRAAKRRRAVEELLPLPIAEEVTEHMEYALTLKQWRKEAKRRYPTEVPAYYRD